MGKTRIHGFTILSLIAAIAVMTACGGGANRDSNNASGTSVSNAPANAPANVSRANGNAEELGLIVNFTLEPEDLVWKTDDVKGSVTAVFRLDAEGTKKLSEEIAAGKAGAPREVSAEDWFPPELVAQADTGGDSTLKGTAYPASMFFQDPFSKGTITRIEGTDFFALELQSK